MNIIWYRDAERKQVRMELHPKIAEIAKTESQPWQGPDGKGAPADAKDLKVRFPVMDTTEVKTMVMVPDGKTIVLILKGNEKQARVIVLVKPTVMVPKEDRGKEEEPRL